MRVRSRLLQHLQQTRAPPLYFGTIHQVSAVFDKDVHIFYVMDLEREWVVSKIATFDVTDAHPCNRLRKFTAVQGIILKYHQGIEKLTHPGLSLYLSQRKIFMRSEP